MRIDLEQAIVKLQSGDVVAIPTETVYGLAADARNESALRQIYAIKQRPANNPLIVHIAEIQQVTAWAEQFPALAERIASAFWPGPLTIVLNAQTHVSKVLTAGQSTIALRVPNHPVALTLLKDSGLALAAPSANKYTQLSPTSVLHVEAGLGESIPVLDGGDCKVGLESTIIQLYLDASNQWQWQLLRSGMISEHEIYLVAQQLPAPMKIDQAFMAKVPGQHLLHYSPKTPLKACASRALLIDAVKDLNRRNITCAALLLGDGAMPNCFCLPLANHPIEYAVHLYRALHQLDALAVAQILVELPIANADWLPILDRLNRATHD